MIGPGKYDNLCTEVRIKSKAAGVILIIAEGEKGWGFSVQAPLGTHFQLAALLRNVANTIESDLKKGKL